MDGERLALFDCLYRRIGELTSHAGRYEMQLIALAWTLTDETVLQELIENWPVETRIDVITRLMRVRKIPVALQTQFTEIHQQMRPVFERLAISIAHPAVSTQVGFAGAGKLGFPHTPKHNWFNRTTKISKEEIAVSVESLERDIMTAVKLQLSLATLSSRVQRAGREARMVAPSPLSPVWPAALT